MDDTAPSLARSPNSDLNNVLKSLNPLFVVTTCAIPFALFVLGPSWFDPLFLAGYVSAIVGLMMLPVVKRGISLVRAYNLYRGLMGTIGIGIVVSLLLNLPWGIFGSGTSRYTAALLIFLSLIAPFGSAFNVSRLGNLVRQEGLDPLRLQTRARIGVQHFSLEYSSLRWLSHARYSLISLASLAAYFYGWSLFGLSLLAYSIALQLVMTLALLRLPKKLLSPNNPNEVLARIHSIIAGQAVKTGGI